MGRRRAARLPPNGRDGEEREEGGKRAGLVFFGLSFLRDTRGNREDFEGVDCTCLKIEGAFCNGAIFGRVSKLVFLVWRFRIGGNKTRNFSPS